MKTVTPSVTLWAKCDRCEATEHWVNFDEDMAAKAAESDGWRLSNDAQPLDLCPSCAKKDAN